MIGALARGAAWSGLAACLQALLAIATLAVMARFVGPEAFGVMAIAWIVVGLVEVVSGAALTESLVQRREAQDGHFDITFWSVLGIALLAWAAIAFAAGSIGSLFAMPVLAAVLPLRAATLPFSASGAVPMARLTREMRFRTVAFIDSTAAISASAVGLVSALGGLGIWSFVAMELTRAIVRTGCAFAVTRWMPGIKCRLKHARDLGFFNANIVAGKVASHIDHAAPRIVIGAAFGAESLGYYALAWRLYEQVSAVLIGPLHQVANAGAARAQADMALIRRLLASAIRTSSMVAYPVFLGLIAVAPILVPMIFGPQWENAIVIVQITLLLGIKSANSAFNGAVLKGVGRPDLHLMIVSIGALLSIVLSVLAIPFGPAGIAIAVVLRALATWPISAARVERITGFPARSQATIGLGALAAAALMALGVYALQVQLIGLRPAPLLLIALIGLGAAIYLVGLMVFDRHSATAAVKGMIGLARGDMTPARAFFNR